MKKAIRKAAVFGLSAALALTSLSGCSKKEETFDTEAAAITVDGDTVSAGVVNFAVRYTQASVETLYQSFGVDDPFNQDMFGTGSTLGEQAKSQAVSTLTRALMAEQHMEDYGVTVTDEEKEQISAAAAKFIADNDESVLETISATQEIVERYMELTLIQYKVEEQMTVDVDTEVSDAEAAQRKIQYVLFPPVTETESETEIETEALSEDGETEELPDAAGTEAEIETEAETAGETEAEADTEAETAALVNNNSSNSKSADETEEISEAETDTEAVTEAETETESETEDPETVAARERALVQAQEMLDKVKAGADFEEAAEEMGKTVSENTFGSDYSVTELVEATDGLEDGTLVEEPVLTSTGSYYVVKLVSQLDREATDEKKDEIVQDRKEACIDEVYSQWTEDAEVSTDEEVTAKITFDYHLAQPAAEETEGITEAYSEADETELLTEEAVTDAEAEVLTEEAETEAETAAQEAAAEPETETSPVETESEAQ